MCLSPSVDTKNRVAPPPPPSLVHWLLFARPREFPSAQLPLVSLCHQVKILISQVAAYQPVSTSKNFKVPGCCLSACVNK